MGFWDRVKDPFKGVPVVGGLLEAGYDMLPIDNAVRSVEEFSKGNWAGGLGNLGYGALETASFFVPGSSLAVKGAARGAGLGAEQAAKLTAKQYVKNLGKAPIKAVAGSVGAGIRSGKTYAGAVKAAPIKTVAGSVGAGIRSGKTYAGAVKAAPVTTLGKSAIKYAKADKPSYAIGALRNYLPDDDVKQVKATAAGLPRTTSAASFRQLEEKQRRAATPDSLERMVAYNKQRAASTPDALERMALYKRQQELLAAQKARQSSAANKKKKKKKSKTPQSSGAGLTSGVYGGPGFEMSGLPNIDFSNIDLSNIAIDPNTVVDIAPTQDNPAEDKLAALTAEQQKQLMDSQQQLTSEYDALIAAFNKRDAEARQQEQQARGMAQNIAAGESQNLRTNLAAIGMEESPGPAIVGQESISAGSRAQQDAANLTLASLISQIALEKQQAESRKKLQETELARMEREMRTQNTLAALLDAYKQAGEA